MKSRRHFYYAKLDVIHFQNPCHFKSLFIYDGFKFFYYCKRAQKFNCFENNNNKMKKRIVKYFIQFLYAQNENKNQCTHNNVKTSVFHMQN